MSDKILLLLLLLLLPVLDINPFGLMAQQSILPLLREHWFPLGEIATPTMCGLGGTVHSDAPFPTREANEIPGDFLHQSLTLIALYSSCVGLCAPWAQPLSHKTTEHLIDMSHFKNIWYTLSFLGMALYLSPSLKVTGLFPLAQEEGRRSRGVEERRPRSPLKVLLFSPEKFCLCVQW